MSLSINDVVNIQVNMTSAAAAQRNFGSLLILGDSPVIDVNTRWREYTSLAAIGIDYGDSAPEYLAAQLYFSQSPQPASVYLGRWASGATSGQLFGGALSATEQEITNFSGISNGGIGLVIDGNPANLSGLNFEACGNLNAVAAVITTALGGAGTVVWNPTYGQFIGTSGTTGVNSSFAFATAGAGTDISNLLNWEANDGGYTVAGIAAESAVTAVQTLANMTTLWYGLQIAATASVGQSQVLAVAGFIEGASPSHIYGVTSQDQNSLLATSQTDTIYLLQQSGFKRTFSVYSSTTKHASTSVFGRAFTVDFGGSNTTITLKFKQMPGVIPETLSETQAAALKAKGGNVFVNYNINNALGEPIAIMQEGSMANGYFFDEVHGSDWLQNALQVAEFNLYLSTGKVPQTDPGVNQLIVTNSTVFDQAVANGLLAPGVWQGAPLGAIDTGDTLAKGYYQYAPPVASLTAAQRLARNAPLVQAAVVFAGAIHFSSAIVNVTR